jgi:carbon monoxide dehydrogenase subunit G
MPLIIEGEERIAASVVVVWAALNDPDILRACIPGCDSLTRETDTRMNGKVTLKIGPMKASFTGAVTLSDLDPPHGYAISGEGKGGVAGFAKGRANVKLAEDGEATILTYSAEADVGGKLAQLGNRLIGSTATKLAQGFFADFNARVSGN